MASRTKVDQPDDENPEWTEDDFKRARQGREVFSELGIEIPPKRGRPSAQNPKRQVTLRLDADIIEFFKSGGPGWQTRINQALAKAISKSQKKAG